VLRRLVINADDLGLTAGVNSGIFAAHDHGVLTSASVFANACLLGRISQLEVEQELTAQIDRIRTAGVRLTHLDVHEHVHAYPPMFAIVTHLDLLIRQRITLIRRDLSLSEQRSLRHAS
jgi:predicted glycoside hydrolase/deacetylase ChbG (UPF0249 family)